MKKLKLTTKQWEKIKSFLPETPFPRKGRPMADPRITLNAIVYWLNTGVVWRELPEQFGPWQSVYGRLRSWIHQGIWKSIFCALIEEGLVDDSIVPVGSRAFYPKYRTGSSI